MFDDLATDVHRRHYGRIHRRSVQPASEPRLKAMAEQLSRASLETYEPDDADPRFDSLLAATVRLADGDYERLARYRPAGLTEGESHE